MKIEFVEIQNFRKLKNCRIDLSDKKTVFVGANNSGKTTAMHALIKFLKKHNFSTRDFTLTNWLALNEIGKSWTEEDVSNLDLSLDKWVEHLPTLDIWLSVEENEIHYVNHLIPTLDWNGGSLGVRLRFEPKNIEDLYREFHSAYENAKSIKNAGKIKLWPNHLWDFLDKKGNLNRLFSIKTYLLDPTLKTSFQKLPENSPPLDSEVFSGLVRVDIIGAQRGFSDVNSDGNDASDKNLSSQLRSYYDKHLNPLERPTNEDMGALEAIQSAKDLFDENLKKSFHSSLTELEELNYPGFGNPKITLSSKFETADTLNHDSSVQYNLSGENEELSLSEKYNGLGYQNLISMIFKLIRFRDEWMQIGKSYTNESGKSIEKEFEPLHLVLIEEPEAHLHAQVQQVFVKKAYDILRNNKNIKDNNKFTTQLVISTHSNHIAHEIDFVSLRYFKRVIADKTGKSGIDTSDVINLSKLFGGQDETTKFATRYLKTTHCDLFFADAVIMIEGTVERMLLPSFIKNDGESLNSCYISILEIGGSHAHTLRPLIEALGIICLIITDLDSKDNGKKIQPEKSKNYKTGNNTLKKWIPAKDDLDHLLDLKEKDKIDSTLPIRVAFQVPLKIDKVEVFPYTFEDSLVMENRDIFKALNHTSGLLGNIITAAKKADIKESAKDMYEAITDKGAKKAEFALELLYLQEPNELKTPQYIKEGLDWLRGKLLEGKDGFNDIKK